MVTHLEALANAVEGLDNKVTGMKEGEVLTRGIAPKRGLIAQTATNELRSDATAVKK